MKIFITGGAGFIGSNFIRHVLSLNKGYKIVNYDKLTYDGNLANLESAAVHPDYSFVQVIICVASASVYACLPRALKQLFDTVSFTPRSIYLSTPLYTLY